MDHPHSTTGKRTRFGELRRKAVDITSASLVKTSTLGPERALPLIVEPALEDVDLAGWALSNREFLNTSVLKHGAVLFRNFETNSVADFERVSSAICESLFAEYGDLPREGVSDRIYQSTPYPSDKTILFHNESSHLPSWPRKQFFMCIQPSREGGHTPLLDCREVYRRLPGEIRNRFEKQGLAYVRNFIPGIDVSWQEFFHTDDRMRVEAACLDEGMICQWKDGDRLCIRQHSPAVITHPTTGEKVFFNQIQLHHPSCLDPETRTSLLSLFGPDDLPRNVLYGDGTPIDDAVMTTIGQLYWELSVSFPWQAGDLVMVENMLVAHARTPYVGPRKIVVAMGEMFHAADLGPEQTRSLTS